MSGEQLPELISRVLFAALKDLNGAHDDTRCTESALYCRLIDKSLLNIRELAVRSHQPFQSADFFSVRPHCKIDAGVKALSVDDHIAGAALAHLAAFLDTGQGIIIAKHIGERSSYIDHRLTLHTVDTAAHQFILLSALGICHDRMAGCS